MGAYIQKNTPPPNKVFNFSLNDFSGGLNNRSDLLEDNELTSINNMIFADESLFEKRKGQELYDESIDFDEPIVFLDEFKPYKEENVLIQATPTKFYVNGALLTTIEGKVSGINHRGRYFFADGSKLYCYGKFAQTEGDYVKITGTEVDDYVLMEVVTPDEGYTPLEGEHIEGVTHINYTDYEVSYEPCKLEVDDEFKGDNVVPEGVRYIASHLGRMFVSGADDDNDNVFITDVKNSFYFPVFLPMQLPPNSDRIVGLKVYDNSVLVGREKDIHAITGNTNRPDFGVEVFRLNKLNTHVGFASHHAVDIAHNFLFFLGSDANVYALSTTKGDDRVLVTKHISRQLDMRKEPISIDINDLSDSHSAFVRDEWFLTIQDKTLVYSYLTQAWTVLSDLDATSSYEKDFELIWGNSDGKLVHFSPDNYTDFGEPYECHIFSKYFDMDEASNFKSFKEFFVVAHTYENYNSDIRAFFEIDYDDVRDRVVIANQISIWGTAVWGDRFIKHNINPSLPFVIRRRGRNIRFKFFNGYYRDGDVATHSDLETYEGRIEGVMVWVTDEENFYLYKDREWVLLTDKDLNQRMKIYQVNGDYEMRGKR